MNHRINPFWKGLLILSVLLLTGCEYLKGPQTTIATETIQNQNIMDLYSLVTYFAIGVFIAVAIPFFIIVFKFRAKPGDDELPEQVHGNVKLEIIWTIIPIVILLILGYPSTKAIWKRFEPAPDDALVIRVVGHQWWWEFQYPEDGINLGNEATVPAGRAIKFELESADVVHSFWVPRLDGKVDVVPGLHNSFWTQMPEVEKETYYYGQCAELCGESHALMRFMIRVLPKEDYTKWVARQKGKMAPLANAAAKRGRDVFKGKGTCFVCHTIKGLSPGVIGPNLTNFAERDRVGDALLKNNSQNLYNWIQHGEEIKPGNLMKLPLPLTEDEANDLVAFLQTPFVTEEESKTLDYSVEDKLVSTKVVTENTNEPAALNGQALFAAKTCIACHVTAPGAAKTIGPNLAGLAAKETIVEGLLTNTRENLLKWMKDPQGMKPGTLMTPTTTDD